MHLDVGHTPDAMNIHLVRELTEKYRRGGRVVVGHMAKLSLLPPEQVSGAGAAPGGCRHRRHGAAGDRSLPDGARPGAQRAARRGGRQSADRARRQLLAFVQQHPQSGDALRRLLADPHGEPLRQRPPARSPGRAARVLPHAHRPVGSSAQPPGLRAWRSAIRPTSSSSMRNRPSRRSPKSRNPLRPSRAAGRRLLGRFLSCCGHNRRLRARPLGPS